MKFHEKFLVMSTVDKFSKFWENFGMTLKHQKGRLSLDDLMIAINIEEKYRNQTNKMSVEHQPRASLIMGKQKENKVNSSSKAINKETVNMFVGGSSGANTQEQLKGYLDDDLFKVRVENNNKNDVSNSIIWNTESFTLCGIVDERRRSKRARVVKDFGSDFVTYNIEYDPVTFKDAMDSLEVKQWKEAVKSEMDSIVFNGTWVFANLPPGCITIGSLLKNESGVSVAQLRILRNLKGTISLAIHNGRFLAVLEEYSDARWIAK
ncbi:UNVERIFIED_CONTAM: hypothetical protein Scaly_0466000 [Sesamum calycinum]|uniref:Uncharacterized protein n=1 Tax=Sesamum calycinum TaxID=2727403 RepID=A0AAW2SF70_9LAMI